MALYPILINYKLKIWFAVFRGLELIIIVKLKIVNLVIELWLLPVFGGCPPKRSNPIVEVVTSSLK